MKVSEYIAQYLQKQGVTDAFGIPGGVILELMYALDATEGITPHLSFHEQCAGFAACGYAQAGGKLGVAYATKGPGFTNLLTAMADAYYDSIPVLFITAHSAATLPEGCRLVADQDMDTCGMVRNITKYAKRIDDIEEISISLEKACQIAKDGRKGPVFLDIAASLFKKEMITSTSVYLQGEHIEPERYVSFICSEIKTAKRPVILLGDGINQSATNDAINHFIEKAGVPVLSSRYCHNIIRNQEYYYGYVGSHGIRYANFILSKADLVISLGNRLYFPSNSVSYSKIINHAKFLRFDIDDGELNKHHDMENGVKVDLASLLSALEQSDSDFGSHDDWVHICNVLRKELWAEDVNSAVDLLSGLLKNISIDYTLVNDVGNNEFWMSRACVYAQVKNRTLYSKSFGALGNALGKAIGAYYATRKPVVAFMGDQGFQMNVQELQFIAQHRLPIAIVILNNDSSGMIKDREAMAGYAYSLHTTRESGYGTPDFSALAKAYGISWFKADSDFSLGEIIEPMMIELLIPDYQTLTPSLPRGRDMQDLEPRIDNLKYNKLNAL